MVSFNSNGSDYSETRVRLPESHYNRFAFQPESVITEFVANGLGGMRQGVTVVRTQTVWQRAVIGFDSLNNW
jgi:hypothetical protein